MQYLFPVLADCIELSAPGELAEPMRGFIDEVFQEVIEEIPLVFSSACHYLEDRMIGPRCSRYLVLSLLFILLAYPALLTENICCSLYTSLIVTLNRQLCQESQESPDEDEEETYSDILTILMSRQSRYSSLCTRLTLARFAIDS